MAAQTLHDSLDDLISKEAIQTVLQPIVDLRRQQAVGYEALSRGKPGQMLQRPDLMFQAANQAERIPELESLCIRSAIKHFRQSELNGQLFLNICPQTLLSYSATLISLSEQLVAVGLSPRSVVLEISERFPFDACDKFIEVISSLKQLGYGIAIDDLGSGYSGLKLWSQIRPDYVKIDRHFIDRIDQDTVKQAFVTSVVNLCGELQCEIIAEGIEQVGELNLIRSLGIHLGQGYLLGKPAAQPEILTPGNHTPIADYKQLLHEQTIGSLCQSCPILDSHVTIRDAGQMLEDQPALQSVPVLEDNRPVGLLYRSKLLETFALPYGRALFEKKDISQIMQHDALIVDASMSIETVSRLMTNDDEHSLRQHLIVTCAGVYQGLVSTKELLKRLTESQIMKARYANPLTMLPGNVLIDEHTDGLMQSATQFNLLYADLNHFKPFNDHYGYRQGDNVIRWLGHLLQSMADDKTFVGHVGGDDFVLVYQGDEVADLCGRILQRFQCGVPEFHSSLDWGQGYISGSDRNGQPANFPLLGLAIGVVPSSLIADDSASDLASLAALAKKAAKKKGGNAWYCLNRNSSVPELTLIR